MCIALVKPLGKKLEKQIYRNCFSNNDDGAGFAYLRDGKLCTAKGFFTFEDFWEYYEPLEEQARLVHFRVGTSGGMTGENCHPWSVADRELNGDLIDLAFIHNGVISINRPYQNYSDTGNFNELILKLLVKTDPNFWKHKEFKWMIESSIGIGNKLAMMDHNGDVEIFNENAGKWEDDVWFSNGTYAYPKNTSSNYYSCDVGYSSGGTSHYHNQFDSSESVDDTGVVDRVDDSTVSEDDFAGIDVDEIDARLEAAEKRRLSSK